MAQQPLLPLYFNFLSPMVEYYGADFLLENWHTKEIKTPTGDVITIDHLKAVIEHMQIEDAARQKEIALERKEILQTEYNFPQTLGDLISKDECPFIPKK